MTFKLKKEFVSTKQDDFHKNIERVYYREKEIGAFVYKAKYCACYITEPDGELSCFRHDVISSDEAIEYICLEFQMEINNALDFLSKHTDLHKDLEAEA